MPPYPLVSMRMKLPARLVHVASIPNSCVYKLSSQTCNMECLLFLTHNNLRIKLVSNYIVIENQNKRVNKNTRIIMCQLTSHSTQVYIHVQVQLSNLVDNLQLHYSILTLLHHLTFLLTLQLQTL